MIENPKEINYFAKANYRNKEAKFGIKLKDRRQHMYVIGKTGVGKTELLKNMALQDVENGHGLAIVDPHGEFVEEVLENIPEHRMDDVVYFNPADTNNPVGFNIIHAPDAKYKHLIASGLMGIFTKIWANVWSARMEYILNNCILSLVEMPNATMLGIVRVLVDKDYRQRVVDRLDDPVIKSFWINEYEEWNDRFRNEAIAPIQNKVGQFLSASLIRNIVGQPKSTIDIQDIMDNRKILLVNVSKGLIGEDNSALLGAMLITKIQLAAMERVKIRPEERKDFFLYVDEFQNFVTDSFADILSEARKYKLNLVFAHQYIGQLVTDASTKVRDAVFGNVGSLVSFRVGAADAEFLEKEFEPKFYINDIVNLENYNIYLKLMIDGVNSHPFSATTLPPRDPVTDRALNKEKIISISRKKYSRSVKEVEEAINNWSNTGDEDSSGGKPGGKPGEKKKSTVRDPSLDDPEATYPDICWECGTDVKLKFLSDGVRPVYCKNCLGKARSGKEDLSLSFKPKAKKPKKEKVESADKLAELGIGVNVDNLEADLAGPVSKNSRSASRKQSGPQKKGRRRLSIPNRKKMQPDTKGVKSAIKQAMEKAMKEKREEKSEE